MTDLYAVIGNPINHSKSPLIHAMFAKATGQDMRYDAIEGPLGEFGATVDAFRAAGARGLNVTVPFKLDAFAYATECSKRATMAGASNALKFETAREGGRIFAENFDGVGLVRDVQDNLRCVMKGKRVLLLGAGGAARGVLLPFLEQQPAQLTLANRTASKAAELAALVAPSGRVIACGLDQLQGQHFDLVFNSTSASLGDELPAVPPEVFAPGCLAYELAYGKGLTPFLKLARSAGAARLADGVGMLAEQAAEAFLWWRGVRPQTREVIDKITVPLV